MKFQLRKSKNLHLQEIETEILKIKKLKIPALDEITPT